MDFPGAFVITFLILWQLALTLFLWWAYRTYKHLTQGIDNKDVATILSHLKKHDRVIDKQISQITTKLDHLDHRLQSHIQKLGFIRYNPFGDTGGDQSFCLCLLDQHNNGILITSLHTRQQTRIYTKQISQGKDLSGAELSKEELACIKNAQRWSNL